MAKFGRFLAELKKRHVYRVAVAYAIAAWAIIEVTSTIVPELALPSWITPAVIIFSIVGFPLALVLAWAYDLGPDGVERTAAADGSTHGAPRRRLTTRRALPAVALLLIVAAGIAAAAVSARSRSVPRGDALLAELVRRAGDQRYADAFALAQRARAELPDSVTALFTDHFSITSDPAAVVRVRRFVPADEAATATDTAAWQELGRTPLRGAAVVRGDYHVRIEAPGFAPVERILSSAGDRGAFGNRQPGEMRLDVRLLPADRVPADMVHVPGGLYRVASRDLQSLAATLDDFFIDRHEVTNADFIDFVDAGGYGRREYWSDLTEMEHANAGDVLRTFIDRTGMPAPREWSGQRPAAGTEQHPVTGVSWYEASAYCRYRRKTLPTLYEWEKAARDGETSPFGVELPWGYVGSREPPTGRANFGGQGTVPVGSFPFGISPYGAYDMAGNAKEWLRNRSEGGRAVTGGSWSDPLYIFSEVGSVSATTSSPAIGFRCARSASDERGTPAAQGGEPLRLAVQTPVYTPVSDAEFRALLTLYNYDAQPLNARVDERLDAPGWTRERITYDGPGGTRVIAYLFLPKSAQPPFETIVFMPSTLAFLGGNLATMVERELSPLIRGGRAAFTVVMEGMTEREVPGASPPAPSSVAFQDQMVRRGKELRLGLDYLETREDIDISRLAYLGVSWGAGSRLLYAAIDERFKATVLVGAGIDERVQPTLPAASNINFAPRIRGAKLIVNGREDEEHPWLTRALPLWNLLSEPKELALFDGVGHMPPPELRIPVIRDFLDRHLR